MKYHPHIDGLRAVAILFVLFFHADIKLFPSGFIGVDIFFVISGFLITSIIYKSLLDEQFSFIHFYNRRLWRLQPVFICLILITTVLTLIFYIPIDLQQFTDSARKAAIFKSNTYFEKATTDYFSQNSKILPLLHTWSLSIEWQCYLILPLALYLIYRIFTKRYFPYVIYSLTILSFILYFLFIYPNHTYYRFPSRIFEFLIGSCIAVNSIRFSLNKYLIEFISAAAIGILFYIATLHDISFDFPNLYAVILCIATGALILAGSASYKSTSVTFLSLRPMVFLGLISYSLYIWHWPLFALLNYLNIQTSLIWLLAFIVVFIIAYLSWKFIEKPTRPLYKMSIVSTCFCLLIIPIVLTQFSAKVIKKHAGLPSRFPEVVQINQQLDKYASAQRAACLVSKSAEVDEQCKFGSLDLNNKKALMIGDSFANHYWKFMEVLAKDANITILGNSTIYCLALPGIIQYHAPWMRKQGIHEECLNQTQRYYQMIAINHYDYVILGQSWNGYFSSKIVNQINDESSPELIKKRIEVALERALQIIIASGAKPVLVKSIPTSPRGNSYECFFNHMRQRKSYDPKQCEYTISEADQEWVNITFSNLQLKYPQLIVIDPQQLLCVGNQCKADINFIPVFRDESHITDYASYQLGKQYLERFKNPLVG